MFFSNHESRNRHDEPEEWLLGIPTDSHQIDEVSLFFFVAPNQMIFEDKNIV